MSQHRFTVLVETDDAVLIDRAENGFGSAQGPIIPISPSDWTLEDLTFALGKPCVRTARIAGYKADTYRPLIDVTTGRELHAIGSALLPNTHRLDPTDEAGTFVDPKTGTLWFGCTDNVWRQRS